MKTFLKKQYVILVIGLAVFTQWGYAQEQLVPLGGNDAIKKTHKQLPKPKPQKPQSSTQFIYYEPVLLPFIDDFSDYTGYPDTALWIGGQTYVNQSFAVAPPSIGCVTLDAVDERGFIYAHAKTTPFPADTLLSRPIRLDSIFSPYPMPLTPSEAVYFSFFYQPGGGVGYHWELLGDAPETDDSLVLEFGYQTGEIVLLYYITVPQMVGPSDTLRPGDTLFSQCDTTLYIVVDDYHFPGDILDMPCDSVTGMEIIWEKVWGDEGRTLEKFVQTYGDTFRQVMIPITDLKYFNRGFQFRFRNYASIQLDNNISAYGSNADYWNIDYVRLDRGRSSADTTIDDVAFVYNPGGLLKNYTAMPWNQFKDNETAELRTDFTNYLTNLSGVVKNTSYLYKILDENKNAIDSFNGGSYNISPFCNTRSYQTYQPHANPALIPITFPAAASDSVTIFVQHIFKEAGSGDKNPKNDTVVYVQNFHNYYAYDDGKPESGYIVTSPSNPYKKSLALEFTLNKPDTLRAVDIYFNYTLNDATFINFTLSVWEYDGDTNGMPGKELHTQEVNQEYSLDLYGFQRFYLTKPLPVSGKFFIGYQIAGQNKLLNIGFDQNNDASSHTFWRTNGEWGGSFLVGSPMLRPVLGADFPQTDITEPLTAKNFDVKIYPNPAKNELRISLPNSSEGVAYTVENIDIYNVMGQRVMTSPNPSKTSAPLSFHGGEQSPFEGGKGDVFEGEKSPSLSERAGGEAVIDVSHLPSGFYILQLIDNKNNIKAIRKFSIIK